MNIEWNRLNKKSNLSSRNTVFFRLCLGQDSGRIVIWNMSPVVDVKQENDPNVPRILCQMDHHIGMKIN